MANVEKSGYMKYKDKSGNMTTMYPKTKVANVEGLSDELAGKETSGAAATALSDAKAYTDQKIAAIPTPESDIFWATYGTTTFTEAKAAYDARKEVVVLRRTGDDDQRIFRLSHINSTGNIAVFSYIHKMNTTESGDEDWYKGSCYLLLLDSTGWSEPTPVRFLPRLHASKHAADGEDPITPAAIGAATMTEVNAAIQSAIQNTWEASY